MSLSQTLRAALESDPRPALHIARAAGIDIAVLSRFRRGLRTIRLDSADKLAAELGLELVPKRGGKGR